MRRFSGVTSSSSSCARNSRQPSRLSLLMGIRRRASSEPEEREKGLKEIRQLENRKKILENKQRNEERRVRTRRLIERGAVLEGIFPLAPDLSGAEVKAFLIALSHLPGAAELTANLPKSGDTP